MGSHAEQSEDLIAIGKFSKLSGVSQRALHVYEEKGLLTPVHINRETGYRYYSYEQYAQVDGILKLKGAGFSLDEIKQAYETQSIDYLETMLQKKEAKLTELEKQVALTRKVIDELEEGCRQIKHPPPAGQIMMEKLPPQTVFVVDSPDNLSVADANQACALSSQKNRDELQRYGLAPVFTADRGGGMMSRESILQGHPQYVRSYYPIEDPASYPPDRIAEIPGGLHLIIYVDFHKNDGAGNILRTSAEAAKQLAAYAGAHGFSIAGDCFDVGVAGTPFFGYGGSEYFFKLCLPVETRP